MSVETKVFGGRIIETKQGSVNGVPVGVFEGYMATWDPDLGGRYGIPDQFVRGAFTDALRDHRERNMRQVRLKDQHGVIVGGWPIETVREDENGLRGTGHINLEKQAGRELWSLMRQGVIVDLSVSYIVAEDGDKLEGDVRRIHKVEELVEASPVDEPNNRKAVILELKAVVPFQDLPLAPRERAWDSDAAVGRIREATGSGEKPSASYKNAFLWYDSADAGNFGAYKLPIADVVDGRIMAVPKGISAAAGALRGARGGVKIPDADRPKVVQHLERYYAKMDEDSPFESDERQFVRAPEVKDLSAEALEGMLRRGAIWSRSAAHLVAVKVFDLQESKSVQYDQKQVADLLESMQSATRILREGRAPRT